MNKAIALRSMVYTEGQRLVDFILRLLFQTPEHCFRHALPV
jgi:hypothetical protein